MKANLDESFKGKLEDETQKALVEIESYPSVINAIMNEKAI